jgi:hypothetical protein
MPYRKWAPADHLGAALWVVVFIAIGYGLGAAGITLDSTDRYFRYVEWAILAVIALWGMLVFRSSHAAIMSRISDALRDENNRGEASRGGGDDEPERDRVGAGARD